MLKIPQPLASYLEIINMLGPEQHESGGGGASGGSSEVGASSSIPSGGGMGELSERSGGGGGNRWPRQETLALLRIRSDMDVAFRDSNIKGPLWEEISRKMTELGFSRSAKKCKEKFENVYKYHKRTKDGRTSKPDGKTYRFFNQLKALENNTSPLSYAPPPPPQLLPPPTATAAPPCTTTNIPMPSHVNIPSTTSNIASTQPANNIPINYLPSYQPSQQPPIIPSPQTQPTFQPSHHIPHMSTGFLSNSTSSSSTSSDEDAQLRRGKKRKWKDFFEKLMKEVIQKQDELQKKFLDTLEKRETDRISREEAWRVQEMAKMNREHELLVKERSMASAKDAAVTAFLQKLSEQHNLKIPNNNNTNKAPPPLPQAAMQAQPPPPPPPPPQSTTPPPPQVTMSTQTQMMVVSVNDNGSTHGAASSSRWPKEEIEALINIRTGLDFKYQDNGPKGPLWEEISADMGKLGYNRSSKRCKEKWENINKYYKKVKESNKKRPEESKTCPYFNQLEAIYKEKAKNDVPSYNPAGYTTKPEHQIPIMARPEQQWPLPDPQQQHDSVMAVQESDINDIDVEDDDEEEYEEAERYEILETNKQTSSSVTNAVE